MATKVKFTSPFGTAQYPHISSPDTKGKYADNKYKTKLTLPLGDPAAQAFIKQIEAAATELGRDGKRDYRPYVEDEDANTVTFTFKSQYQPSVFDSKNNPIPSSVRIGAVRFSAFSETSRHTAKGPRLVSAPTLTRFR